LTFEPSFLSVGLNRAATVSKTNFSAQFRCRLRQPLFHGLDDRQLVDVATPRHVQGVGDESVSELRPNEGADGAVDDGGHAECVPRSLLHRMSGQSALHKQGGGSAVSGGMSAVRGSKPTPTTFKPYEPNNNISNITTAADCGATNLSSNNTSAQQRVKTPKSMTNGGGQRCDSNQSASSQHRESPTAAGSLRRTPTSGLAGGVMQHNGSPGLPPTASTTPGRSNSKESAAMHSPSAAAAAAAAAAQIASSNRLQEAALAAAKEANYVKALHAASQQGSASAAAAAASYYPPGKCHLKLWVVEIRRAQASEYFVRSLEMW